MKIAAMLFASLLAAIVLPVAHAQSQDAASGKPLSLVVPFRLGARPMQWRAPSPTN